MYRSAIVSFWTQRERASAAVAEPQPEVSREETLLEEFRSLRSALDALDAEISIFKVQHCVTRDRKLCVMASDFSEARELQNTLADLTRRRSRLSQRCSDALAAWSEAKR